MSEELDFEDHIELIKERLHYRRIGMSKKTLAALDFDAWVEEDIEWLLRVVEDDDAQVVERVEEAQDKFQEIKGEILKLPDAFNGTAKSILAVEARVKALAVSLQQAQKDVARMRDELGLFDATEDLQLHAAREELAACRRELTDLATTYQTAQDSFKAEIDWLKSECAKKQKENEAFREQIAKLPPSWQERVLAESVRLPHWVKIGTQVKSVECEIDGEIVECNLESVKIRTMLGDVVCSLNRPLDRDWVPKPKR